MKVPLIGCGVLALGWGLLFTCAGIGMIVDPNEGSSRLDGVFAGSLFGGLPLVFGVAMLLAAVFLHLKDRRVNSQLAWIRTRDRFTIDEFAHAHSITPADGEAQLLALLQRPRAPRLVYHRKGKEYIQRDRIKESGRLVDRCGSCQSPQNVLLLAGEAGSCTACGATL